MRDSQVDTLRKQLATALDASWSVEILTDHDAGFELRLRHPWSDGFDMRWKSPVTAERVMNDVRKNAELQLQDKILSEATWLDGELKGCHSANLLAQLLKIAQIWRWEPAESRAVAQLLVEAELISEDQRAWIGRWPDWRDF